jgi:catechol 2,3-dioxygenase-like lactoylglutathione lyase family enzyme
MKPLGVNRVTIAVKDLQKGKALYSDLLGATFFTADAQEAAKMGIEVAMSWDAGIELVAPLPDKDSFVKHIIEQRGEGVIGVVFAVDNIDQVHQAAQKRGIKAWHSLDYSPEEIDRFFQGRFSKYKEYMYDPSTTYGAAPVVGQFDLK